MLLGERGGNAAISDDDPVEGVSDFVGEIAGARRVLTSALSFAFIAIAAPRSISCGIRRPALFSDSCDRALTSRQWIPMPTKLSRVACFQGFGQAGKPS